MKQKIEGDVGITVPLKKTTNLEEQQQNKLVTTKKKRTRGRINSISSSSSVGSIRFRRKPGRKRLRKRTFRKRGGACSNKQKHNRPSSTTKQRPPQQATLSGSVSGDYLALVEGTSSSLQQQEALLSASTEDLESPQIEIVVQKTTTKTPALTLSSNLPSRRKKNSKLTKVPEDLLSVVQTNPSIDTTTTTVAPSNTEHQKTTTTKRKIKTASSIITSPTNTIIPNNTSIQTSSTNVNIDQNNTSSTSTIAGDLIQPSSPTSTTPSSPQTTTPGTTNINTSGEQSSNITSTNTTTSPSTHKIIQQSSSTSTTKPTTKKKRVLTKKPTVGSTTQGTTSTPTPKISTTLPILPTDLEVPIPPPLTTISNDQNAHSPTHHHGENSDATTLIDGGLNSSEIQPPQSPTSSVNTSVHIVQQNGSTISSSSTQITTTTPSKTPTKQRTTKPKKTLRRKKKKDLFLSLPLELTISVLSCLEPSSLLKISQTCKVMRQLGGEDILWRTLCNKDYFIRTGQKKPKNLSWMAFYKQIYLFRHPYGHIKLRPYDQSISTVSSSSNNSSGNGGNANNLIQLPSHKFIVQDPSQTFTFKSQLSFSCHGSVCKATHMPTREPVVVSKIEYDPQMLPILKDYRLFAPDSNNLVQQYGDYLDGNAIWHVQQFCSGGSCRQQLDSEHGLFDENEIANICYSVLQGLIHYHEQGKSHGCISASTIMLETHKARSFAKLRDKTLSKLVNEWRLGAAASQSRRVYWRAPESQQSPKMDIWSLAITCLEMAEGKPPHWNLPPSRARSTIINSPPAGFLHPNQWSDNFRKFIEVCLKKDPQRRPDAKVLLEHPFFLENVPNRQPLLAGNVLYPSPRIPSSGSSTTTTSTYMSEDEDNISFPSLSTSHVSFDSVSEDSNWTEGSENFTNDSMSSSTNWF